MTNQFGIGLLNVFQELRLLYNVCRLTRKTDSL